MRGAGPWYEISGPNRQYVYDDILLVIKCSLEWKNLIQMNQRLPHRVLDIGNLSLIIKNCMATEFDRYGGFGSYRGYGTFTRNTLMKAVKKKLTEDYYKKKAITILQNSTILNIWMNHILYRPPGSRYKFLMEHFESLQQDN